MPYVDGYLVPVFKDRLQAYVRIAKKAGKIWREHGALDYKECVGDDMQTKWGIAFPGIAKLKPNEVLIFSFVVFKSKAHRDQVNKKVMKDSRIAEQPPSSMPFDIKRMVYGGFKVQLRIRAIARLAELRSPL